MFFCYSTPLGSLDVHVSQIWDAEQDRGRENCEAEAGLNNVVSLSTL